MYAIFILCFVFHSVFQIVWINYTFYCQKTKDQGDSIYLTPPCTLSYLHLHTCKYFLTHTSHTHNPHTRAHTYIICKYKQIQFLANLSVHRDNEVLNIKQQQEQQQCRRPSAPTERAESERAERASALSLSLRTVKSEIQYRLHAVLLSNKSSSICVRRQKEIELQCRTLWSIYFASLAFLAREHWIWLANARHTSLCFFSCISRWAEHLFVFQQWNGWVKTIIKIK